MSVERDLGKMGDAAYDLLVVGGGVCGVCIARDAALRGLSVALVERQDFAHATSAASSKLIHGGLRYLKNFELSLVRESLRERRIWQSIAPHLVYPLSFVLPNYKRRHASKRWMLRAGLTLYDLLAYDRNQLDDPDQRIAAHRMLSRDEVLARLPGLDPDRLIGAVQYWDCQMYSPERLALACAIDAAEHGAVLANWAGVTSFLRDGERITGAVVEDRIGSGSVEVRAKTVVNASGPWADRLLGEAMDESPRNLVRSKGIHVIVRDLTGDTAVAFETRHGHFFILPWRGQSLIGTTDALFEGDPDDFAVTEKDIEDFLVVINEGLPSADLSRDDVIHFYGGLRPLVESSPGEGTYGASRRAEIVDHAAEGGPEGLLSAMGGKWTTARHIGQQVVDRVVQRLGRDVPACRTDTTPVPGGDFGRWASLLAETREQHGDVSAERIEHLARNYGSRLAEILALERDNPELAEPLGPDRIEHRSEVAFAVRSEMARRLDDVVFRRTGIGTLGDPGTEVLQETAALMAAELSWTDAERDAQIATVQARFVPQSS